MGETTTYAEIKKQHDGEWVLLGEVVTSKDLRILRGKLLWHSTDRDEVYRKAKRLEALRRRRLGLYVVGHTLPESASVDGLLGLDFFQKRRLIIDFRKHFVIVD